ncbi:MAG: hypothetical protein VX339_02855 [Pseudomonadota bacterium]|nr:hypothetical protein [Pseudomonadota bacterium]
MNPRKPSLIVAGLFGAALLSSSALAHADHHGENHHRGHQGEGYHHEHHGDDHHRGHHGKASMEEMCAHFRAGTGPFDREARQQKRAEHRADMAERLKLNDEQREIWAEIHEERQEKHEKRHARMQAKMEKRCDTLNQ